MPFRDRFFQAFAFLLVNEHRQLVRLNVETRIKDADVPGEDADSLLGVEGGLIRVDLGGNGLTVGIGRGKRRRESVCRRVRRRSTSGILRDGPYRLSRW